MKISILDQAPVSSGKTNATALQEAMELAKLGEELGFSRYWIAEHHDLPGLACSAPEVMLGYIGANTKRIRIGSGAVLLPHYKPYKVAEVYNMLSTLFPDRIDVGVGRAPGGSAEVTMALSDNYLENVRKMPQFFHDLIHFLHNDFPADHPNAKIKAAPLPDVPPQVWMLGTSKKSVQLAAEHSCAYAFGLFMSDKDGKEIIKEYRKQFGGKHSHLKPETILTVSAICAETSEKAEEIALSNLLWSLQNETGTGRNGIPSVEEAKNYPFTAEQKEKLEVMRRKMIIGNPRQVKEKLQQLQQSYEVDEIMVVTIVHKFEDRLQSYRLIANEVAGG
ncbi:MAG TPA: LLM class flavin-dependent oxidoreductase [Chondromyces sp.]|nr:LLM class flavin-dependent oxidoreductase [Chondromyces sp.]